MASRPCDEWQQRRYATGRIEGLRIRRENAQICALARKKRIGERIGRALEHQGVLARDA
jgi:hypothetical protein